MCEISVVMPVFNGEKYLKEAIDSILNQTFTDFEFIIINDCSTDKSLDIIQSYKDKRIKIINNKINLQIAESLNKGIRIAKGKYIARMDADDIALTNRLKVQYEFMEKNKDVGLCGSSVIVFNEESTYIHRCPTYYDEIKVLQLFNSTFCHPSVMIRKDILTKYNLSYEKEYEGMEDYQLWLNMSEYTKLANISEPLLRYRKHNEQVTNKMNSNQYEKAKELRGKLLRKIDKSFTDEDILLFFEYCQNTIKYDEEKILNLFKLFKRILIANKKRNIYNHRYLKKVISDNIYWNILNNLNDRNYLLDYKLYSHLMNITNRIKVVIRVKLKGKL